VWRDTTCHSIVGKVSREAEREDAFSRTGPQSTRSTSVFFFFPSPSCCPQLHCQFFPLTEGDDDDDGDDDGGGGRSRRR